MATPNLQPQYFSYQGISDKRSKELYFKELMETYNRFQIVKKLMREVLAPFLEFKKTFDAAADGRETDKECYKRQEYQEAKAMILAYNEVYENNKHITILEKELDFLYDKLAYLKNELLSFKEEASS